MSIAALVAADDDASSTETSNVHVSLTEFAITPSAVNVPGGGTLHVTNDGTATHNLRVVDTDLKTPDLAAGDAGELDLSSLEPGSYELLCEISGHADSGMTASLTITEGGGSAAAAAPEGEHATHDEMDYDQMTADMLDTMAAFPAETEGTGNQLLEPTEVKADGTKVFDLTMELADWEVSPGKVVEAWTFNGMVPAPMMDLDVGDKVEVRVQNDLPIATDIHWHGINVDNANDGVAPLTQDLIEPGTSYTYTFTTDEQAVAMYHPHAHGHMLLPDGMFGAILVGDVRLPLGQTVGLEADPRRPAGEPGDPHGPERRRRDRPVAQRQELPRHPALHRQGRRLDPDPLLQRGHPDPSDAPAPVRPGRRRQGWLPARRPVHGGHPQRGPGRAVLGAGAGRPARCLGVALPHPPPRRVRSRDVRDGHRHHRRVAGTNVPPIRPERLCRSTADHRSMQAMTTSLDVLMIESDPGIASGPATDLLEAGHRLHWCHDSIDHGFRCRGLLEPSTCPLEQHVDVAFVARDGVNPRPTALEAGVRCAIRAHVPIVEQGTEILDPYAPWVTERIMRGDDAVAACERAAANTHGSLEASIRSRISGLLAASTIRADEVHCRFHANGQGLDIELVLPVAVSKRVRHAGGPGAGCGAARRAHLRAGRRADHHLPAPRPPA